MKDNYSPEEELLFLALGGSGEIGMNVNLYGCRGKWLMVDLGMTFSGNEYPGVDLVFADLEFIEERRADLLGIVLTHAHEDHIGAVPYFAKKLGVPLYATPFTARLVAAKLEEEGILDQIELNVINDLDEFEIGPFGISYVPLAHSIAEGNALLIDTPFGRVFHTGDWKIDDEPQVGVPATAAELTEIGDEGVLALVCDSTNVFNPEPSGSEGDVLRGLHAEVAKHKGRRVLVTTFASNVARLQTLGAVAKATNRQLCVAGRSLDRILDVAQACGYLKDFPKPIDFDTAMALPRGEVMIIATGGQGEPRAALSRIAERNHSLSLEAGDVVLFSSRQIPGNEIAIGRIQNRLAERDIVLVTDRQSMIHVSGHPCRPELEALYGWIRPEILVPVHGEIRHMREQARVGLASGIPSAVFQQNGDLVRLAPGKPGKIDTIHAGRLVLDGDMIVQANGDAVVMRRRLSSAGVVSVSVGGNGEVLVDALGLPLESDLEGFVAETRRDVESALAAAKKSRVDASKRREAVRLATRRAAARWTGKKPQIIVMMAEGS